MSSRLFLHESVQAQRTSNLDQLHISKTLTLPAEAVTETFLLLGQRGSGKTNTAAAIAEELFRAGAPFCVLTPIDNWWGLKSSENGQGAGLPVFIFGGDHADLPLNPGDGQLIADVLIEHRISCVVCTQGFSGRERAHFITQFALRLLAKNRQPLHLIVEEADAFIPQRPPKGEEAMLGAMDRLIRWGRSPSAIGGTFITQRSAKINKDVSTQCSVLIAHRTVAPQDIDAIKAWFQYHQEPEKLRQLLTELASLPKGTAFFYSPAWLNHFDKHQVRRRQTYDSAATPKLGEVRNDNRIRAVVDIDVLKDKMAATVAKAKADDPAELRRRILALEKEILALKKAPPKPPDVPKTKDDVSWVAENKRLQKEIVRLNGILKKIHSVTADYLQVDKVTIGQLPLDIKIEPNYVMGQPRLPVPVIEYSSASRRSTPNVKSDLPAGERKILSVCAQYPGGADREQITQITGYKRSSRDTYLQRLSQRGYINFAGNVILSTDAGVAALGSDFEPLPVGPELQRYWLERLPTGESRILQLLLNSSGRLVDRDHITEATGYKRSSRDTYLQRLNNRKLIVADGRGMVRAAAIFF